VQDLGVETVEALLFDLGGVLIDIDFKRALHEWTAISSLSFEELREAFQHNLPYRQHETGELSTKDYFNSLRLSLKLDGSYEQIAAGWNSILVAEISETVEAVRKARMKYPCYVFTNSNPTHQLAWRSRFPQVVASFDRVFVSSEIGLRKPERAAFELIAREIGVAPGSIMFFDDLLENVTGALEAGLLAVHVQSPADVQDALRRLGCTL
jgi:epoxide hydrolase-like predicted phosphatase